MSEVYKCVVAIWSHGHELCLRDRYRVTSGGLVEPANQQLPPAALVCVTDVKCVSFLSDIRTNKLKCGNQLIVWVCTVGMFIVRINVPFSNLINEIRGTKHRLLIGHNLLFSVPT